MLWKQGGELMHSVCVRQWVFRAHSSKTFEGVPEVGAGSPGSGNSPGKGLEGEAVSHVVRKHGYFDRAEALV